jgi:hypothetical protein
VIALVEFLDGTDFTHACQTLTGELPPKGNGKHSDKVTNGGGKARTFVDEYIYRDATGAPYLLVKKFIDEHGKKQYLQFHWDGRKWEKGKPKGPKIPYHLPELLAAPIGTTIYVVEGEKCANALVKLGFVATTNSEGATRRQGRKRKKVDA